MKLLEATSLLAFTGPMGSGKTTLAKELASRGWKLTSFAMPIKGILQIILQSYNRNEFEISQMLYGDLKEVPTRYLNNVSPRYAMQSLGKWGRTQLNSPLTSFPEFPKSLWTSMWEEGYLQVKKEKANLKIVVDDLRFIDEEGAIRRQGGKIIRIHREGYGPGEDISEQEYQSITPDYTIYNFGDPANMLEQLSSTEIN